MSKKSKEATENESENDGDEVADAGAEGMADEGAGGEKKGKKKLVMIAAAVVVILLVVGGLFMSGMLGGGKDKPKEAAEHEEGEEGHGDSGEKGEGQGAAVKNKVAYYELPEFLVNLNTATGRVSFLKMSITLELKDATVLPMIADNKPRIIDTFNTYLRELRAADVQGSAGIYRLREELMTRINMTVGDGVVKDILFSEIIVQ